MRITATLALLVLALAASGAAQTPPESSAASFRRVMLAEIDEAIAKEVEHRASLDADALRQHLARIRKRLVVAMGPLPPPDRPPATRTTGRFDTPTFTVEKLLIESRPSHHVTALLFLPKERAGPVPGVVVACGHSEAAKGYPLYQQAAANLAHHGIAALLYDPLDQGERMQMLDELGRRRHWGTHAHNLLGLRASLLGWTATGLFAWDSLQVVSALAARPEVDADQIGVMGNSGGGTQTAQLLCADDRIKAAAPSCYITSLPTMLRKIGPQDAEQNIPGQLSHGLDHDAYLIARAPVPVLICAKEGDFFPIDGTRAVVARGRQVFERLDAGDRIALRVDDGRHGWSPPLIAASVSFFLRHLADRIETVAFTEFPVPGPEDGRVTASGQALLEPGERSIHDVMRDERDRLATARAKRPLVQRVAMARKLARIPARAAVVPPKLTQRATATGANGRTETFHLAFDRGFHLEATLVERDLPLRTPLLILHDDGRHAAAALRGGDIKHRARLILLDPIGVGAGAPKKERPFYGAFGRDAKDAEIARLLGRSLVGHQAEQIIATAMAVGGGEPIDVRATGRIGIAALHAGAVEPELFGRLELIGGLSSYASLFDRRDIQPYYGSVVPGALITYDLSDLRASLGDRVIERPK